MVCKNCCIGVYGQDVKERPGIQSNTPPAALTLVVVLYNPRTTLLLLLVVVYNADVSL